MTHTQLTLNTISNVDTIQETFKVNEQNVRYFCQTFWYKLYEQAFNVVFDTYVWQLLCISMYVTNDKYIP